MKKTRILITFIILALLLALITIPALAITVDNVQPNSVNNDVQNTLTVTGSDFVDGAVVVLNGATDLSTSFVDASTLTAILPKDFPAGSYSVSVENPDSSSAAYVGALVVSAPPTDTLTPTATSTDAPSPAYARPVVVITAHGTDPDPVQPGKNMTLSLTLNNKGQTNANNIILSFTAGDMMPFKTGGVLTIGQLKPGASQQLTQSFNVSANLAGLTIAPLEVTIDYTDSANTAYTETFTLTLSVQPPAYGYVEPTTTPTPTSLAERPRLIIIGTQTDIDLLQPGTQFELSMQVLNVGDADAKGVTMVIGGATISTADMSGTPGPSNISASGGDFQYFSPLGSSNIQDIGDILEGSQSVATQRLIVNVTTNPGAYPFKISFVYVSPTGNTIIDDQVITLLVQSPPMIDISFYRDPGMLFTNQPNALPIQVTNIGRKSAILGNLVVSSDQATFENSTMQVGFLDAGGYLTLDAMVYPQAAGPLDLKITLDYVDDFNQAKTIEKDVTLDVSEAQEFIPPDESQIPPDGMVIEPQQETVLQVIWRFLRGLLGLDSSQPSAPADGLYPPENGIQPDGPGQSTAVPIIIPPKKG
jgi:hypothetical protein